MNRLALAAVALVRGCREFAANPCDQACSAPTTATRLVQGGTIDVRCVQRR